MIYPLLYNGPINYYARLVREQEIILEQFENYTKQTYRNRCRIMGPNRVLTLSVPVKRLRGIKNLFRDIRIDYDVPWNRIHWKSLVAAYAASPYFDFTADDLAPYYEKKHTFLVDLNRELLVKTLDIIGVKIPSRLTGSFEPILGIEDPRLFLHPKLEPSIADPAFEPVAYHQVFADEHGFRANLSILDLLFNEGPNCMALLKSSLRT